MFKKFLALLCVFSVTLSAFSISADAADDTGEVQSIPYDEITAVQFLKNNGFEDVGATGKPTAWTVKETGGTVGTVADDAKSGNYAAILEATTVASGTILYQNVRGIVENAEYKTGGWLKADKSTNALLKIEWYNEANQVISGKGIEIPLNNVTTTGWKYYENIITAPVGATSADIYLRVKSTGVKVFWDDIYFKGEKDKSAYDETTAIQFFKNNSFEVVAATGKPTGWAFKDTTGTVGTVTGDAKDGLSAATFKAATTPLSGTNIYQSVNGVIQKAEYKIGGWFKADSDYNVRVTIEWHDKTGAGMWGKETEITYRALTQWKAFETSVKAPEGATSAVIMFRPQSSTGVQVYLDNVYFKGKMDESMFEKDSILKEAAPGTGEYLVNGGLEQNIDGVPVGWTPVGINWDSSYTTEKVSNGNYALKIESTPSNSPYIEQLIEVAPDAVYQLSMSINIPEYYGSYGVMPEMTFYSSTEPTDENKIGFITAPSFLKSKTYGKWVNRGWEFTPPAGTKMIRLWVRFFRQGTVYIDDISFNMVDKNILTTDERFYYSDIENGVASARASNVVYGDISGYTVDFRLKYGDDVLDEKAGADISGGEAQYFFKIAKLSDYYKEYTIEATYKDAAGNVINVNSVPVYKYDRPSVLSKNGVYMDSGKPLNPIIAYHVQPEQYEKMVELGINVVQTYTSWATPEAIVSRLDEIQKHGLKALVTLYPGLSSAGSDKNKDNTRAVVTLIKDHPAVFAYAVEDEPLSGSHFTLKSDEDLFKSYQLIRECDPSRPVYIVDAKMQFEYINKRVDLLGLDPYPATGDATKFVYDNTVNAFSEALNGKPVMVINQAFSYIGYWPTVDVLRNMIYQGFFAGGKGTGYYAFDEKSPDGVPMEDSELGQAIKDWYQNESELMFDYFANGKYPSFNSYMDEQNFAYRSFVKDGDIYMVVLNRKQHDATHVNIPLISNNSRVSVGAYSASVFAGGDENIVAGENSLSLTLTAGQAAVYKITPAEAIDTELLKLTSFTDIEEYSWAKEQIGELEESRVVNAPEAGMYKPGESITRGDFAMFLIRAFGLRSKNPENFADVKPDDYFERELAIGKALGILKGSDDKKYDPYSDISRQDARTIVERAIKIKDPNFDISELSELVAGDAEDTITRAEAAVIIYRLMNTEAPVITTQPQSQTVIEGQAAVFTVAAVGTEPLGYQWKKNGADIPGANSAELLMNNVQTSDAGRYSVVITDTKGKAISREAFLTVNAQGENVLVSITTPTAITGVANGTAKDAAALGLPSTVTLNTQSTTAGAIATTEGAIIWDVADSSYNPDSKDAQTFMVEGTVDLPSGVVNTNKLPLTASISVTVKAAETSVTPTSYTLDFDADGGVAVPSQTVESGSKATKPTDPTQAGFTFKGWYTDKTYVTEFDFDMVITDNVTVFAKWEKNAVTPDPDPEPEPTPTPTSVPGTKVEDGQVTTTIPAKPTTDASGKAVAAISGTQLADAIAKAAAEAAKQGKKTKTVIEIEVNANADAKTVGVDLTAETLKRFVESKADALTISTPFGTMTFDDQAAKGILKQSTGTITITAAKVEAAELTAEIREKFGDRPVVSFDVTAGGKEIAQLGGKATVTIPYVLKPGEKPNALVVYYINTAGKLETIRNGKYDPATKTITFKTPHFSRYAVGYNKVSFADVADNAWYSDAVTFAAAREITAGVGNGNFGSNDSVTRAQALVMIMKGFGISPDENTENNFSDAGDTYYTGYLAAAKKLGITSGVGGNRFAPDRQVSRQELFVLVYNTLKNVKELPTASTTKDLADFKDAGKVADYANNAIELFVKAGIIAGNDGNILPGDSASRAQFVQILYNVLMMK